MVLQVGLPESVKAKARRVAEAVEAADASLSSAAEHQATELHAGMSHAPHLPHSAQR